MKRALIPLILCVAAVATPQPKLAAQGQPPTTVTTLPAVKVVWTVPAVGTSRIYYTTSKDELFAYDRTTKTSTLVSRGKMSEIALAPTNDRIAFGRGSENDATDIHIWTLPLDPATGGAAGPARRVSVRSGWGPSFSPDGQRLAFAATDSAGTEQVAVVPVSGGAERIVDATPRLIELIRWSPDGRSLYVGDWGVEGELVAAYRVPLAGGPPVLIAKTGSNFPGPSPDGRLIVTTNENWDSLVVMDPDGNRLGTLPWMSGADIGSWSGSARLFVPNGRTPWKLMAYSLADGSTRALTDSTSDVSTPRWSPDGRRIAVMHRNTAEGLRLMNADGSGVRSLAKHQVPAMDCSWSPDGRWILFARWVEPGI
ncbi:MAG: hypothetical protein Q8N53_18825, partial [Longimicrobiales bacterium]|nr:hypothetical protein [Longimicrobiales bacterium]